MNGPKPLGREFYVGIGTGIVLTIVTCGLYNVLWQWRQMQAMNLLLGREEYNFFTWLVLCVVTCGVYHLYYEYKMGTQIAEVMRSMGYSVSNDLGTLGLLLSFVGTTVVADAVYQTELNKLIPR